MYVLHDFQCMIIIVFGLIIIAFYTLSRTVRAVKEEGEGGDKVVGEREVLEQLITLITTLQQVCPPLPPRPPPHLLRRYSHRALQVNGRLTYSPYSSCQYLILHYIIIYFSP